MTILTCPTCAAGGTRCPAGTPRPAGARAYEAWIVHQPLGACDLCRTSTWNPVTFYVRLARGAGREGHYFCEMCGPAMLALAVASGTLVEDAAGGDH